MSYGPSGLGAVTRRFAGPGGVPHEPPPYRPSQPPIQPPSSQPQPPSSGSPRPPTLPYRFRLPGTHPGVTQPQPPQPPTPQGGPGGVIAYTPSDSTVTGGLPIVQGGGGGTSFNLTLGGLADTLSSPTGLILGIGTAVILALLESRKRQSADVVTA